MVFQQSLELCWRLISSEEVEGTLRIIPASIENARVGRAGLLSVFLAFVCAVAAPGQILVSTDFESDPEASGWIRTGDGATWTSGGAASGAHCLASSSDTWSSPLIEVVPLEWYRLSFKSRAPGPVSNLGSIGYAYWSALFYDGNGEQLLADQYSSVLQSDGWVSNEFRIRAKHTCGANATLVPARMRISFHPIGSQPLFIDDVVVEETTSAEVCNWADSFYDQIPAKLAYVPKATRWSRIPKTIQRLRQGSTLRIVMLGDSVQQDTANSPIDAFIEREYPGVRVELISSTKGGTGVGYFKNHVAEFVTCYRPDLLVIGGISNGSDMGDFQSVVDQVRDFDAQNNHETEILILTRAWSSNNNFGNYFFAPSLRELDQAPSNNAEIPDDYRGRLLQLAAGNGVEYLDMTGIASEFIYGPATAAGLGAPANANGDPYSYWLRDWVHSNDYGKQILGRIFEIYFAPPPSLSLAPAGGMLELSWPVHGTGYTVAVNDTLAAQSWAPMQDPQTISQGRNRIRFTPPAGKRLQFYRLQRQQ